MKCSGTQQWDSMSARVLEIFETTIMSIWKVRCGSIDPLTFLDRDVWHVSRTISMLNQVIQDAGTCMVVSKYSKRRYIIFNRSVGWLFLIIWYAPRRWWLYNQHIPLNAVTKTNAYIPAFFLGGLEMAGIRPSLLMNSGEISISRSSHRGKHQRLLLGACDF